MRQKKFSSAELKVSYTCNMGCRFCWVGDRRSVPKLSLQEQGNSLEYIDQIDDIEEIHISGGEPTLRKDLIPLLGKIKAKKFKSVIIHTNALLFSNPDFADQVLPFLTHAVISLQAATPKSHEYVTRLKDRFDVQLRGIRNVVSSDVIVAINTVMARPTLEDLLIFPGLLSEMGVNYWFITFPFVTGWAKRMSDELLPRSLEELSEHLVPALKIAIEKKVHVIPNGLAFCYFPEFVSYFLKSIHRLQSVGLGGFGSQRKMIDSNTLGDEAMAFAHEVIKLQHVEACKECCFKGSCSGFWPELLDGSLWPKLQRLL